MRLKDRLWCQQELTCQSLSGFASFMRESLRYFARISLDTNLNPKQGKAHFESCLRASLPTHAYPTALWPAPTRPPVCPLALHLFKCSEMTLCLSAYPKATLNHLNIAEIHYVCFIPWGIIMIHHDSMKMTVCVMNLLYSRLLTDDI